ncbi:MAG: hypothetical protein M3310_05470 [Actinomycetota bacterium]|nr:hypothetical protein [Actinomycetota bacterium]
MPEAVVTVASVQAQQTRSGNTRFVLTDEHGREYTTFKEPIARQALAAEGSRARIEFHETQRGNYTNVYLDAVEPLADEAAGEAEQEREADEVAWRTALEAAPYILSGDAVEREVPPEEFFEKLKPLKDLVADDIRGDDGEDDAERGGEATPS